jgi:hypothetical protein
MMNIVRMIITMPSDRDAEDFNMLKSFLKRKYLFKRCL